MPTRLARGTQLLIQRHGIGISGICWILLIREELPKGVAVIHPSGQTFQPRPWARSISTSLAF